MHTQHILDNITFSEFFSLSFSYNNYDFTCRNFRNSKELSFSRLSRSNMLILIFISFIDLLQMCAVEL